MTPLCFAGGGDQSSGYPYCAPAVVVSVGRSDMVPPVSIYLVKIGGDPDDIGVSFTAMTANRKGSPARACLECF